MVEFQMNLSQQRNKGKQMKNVTKLATKAIVLSMILSSSLAVAADGEYTNMTLDGRLYQYDTYGAQWALDTGSDGLWLVPKDDVGGVYSAPFKLRNVAADNTLVIGGNTTGTEGYVGIGTDTPTVKLDVNGVIGATFEASDNDNFRRLLILDVNNMGTGTSNVGFSLKDSEEDYEWSFRTYKPSEGFAATKIGTGGTEFEVGNKGTDLSTTVVKMGGVTVFEGGHMVTSSSRTLKTDIKPLDTKAALDAFHKLQPVSFAYKAHQGEPVVGFIAEDVPELVAMPSRKSFDSAEIVAVLTSVLTETRAEMKARDAEMEAMRAEITELKAMK